MKTADSNFNPSISFSPPLLAAVQAGRKTVTRRRFAGHLGLLEEPGRYHFLGLDAAGAHFEDKATSCLMPVIVYPFGEIGESLRVVEAPGLRLVVTAVRVERVQTITAAEAQAEGICLLDTRTGRTAENPQWGGVEPDLAGGFCWYDNPVKAFAHLFTSFYPLAWERNAWVWVVEFQLLDT